MSEEEIKFDHFKDIEELIKHLEMWYAEDDYFAYDRYFHLRDARIMGMFIYELQQENKQLKENKEGWQRLANKYFNALEDIKEYLKENEKEYGSLEDNEKIILDIVNKVLGSKEDE